MGLSSLKNTNLQLTPVNLLFLYLFDVPVKSLGSDKPLESGLIRATG